MNLVKREGIKRPKCKQVCSTDRFSQESTVLIQQMVNKYSIRVDPDQKETLNGMGGAGSYAQWTAMPSEDGETVMFKSVKTGKFIRMLTEDKISVDGQGQGDVCRWKIHKDKGVVKLENKKWPGKYLAVSSDGKTIKVGAGGALSRLSVKRENKRTPKITEDKEDTSKAADALRSFGNMYGRNVW